MVIQSAGTGLTLFSGSFVVFLAVGEPLVVGDGVAVLVAGFCAQPAVNRATVLKNSRILFIDPPRSVVSGNRTPTEVPKYRRDANAWLYKRGNLPNDFRKRPQLYAT